METGVIMSFKPRSSSLDSYQFTFESYLDDSSHIEPDPNPDMDEQVDTESLSESITKFQKRYGRTYHSYRAGSYHFPNDPTEAERLDFQYEILREMLGGQLYFTPWTKDNPPRKVIDLATGTGRWAIDFGDEFPESDVVGTDLSPIQPNFVPPNVRFYVEDSTDDWDAETRYDYIHTRVTVGCWADAQKQIVQKAFEHLNPGGWFEGQELSPEVHCDDDSVPEGNAWVRYIRDLADASDSVQRPLWWATELRGWMEEAGFVDIQERVFKLPLNGWPRDLRLKEIGLLWQHNLLSGLSGFTYSLMHQVRGQSIEDIEVSLVDVRRDLSDQRCHFYNKFYVVWGRKPG